MVCVVAVVLGAGVLVKRHRQQVAEQQRQERLDNLSLTALIHMHWDY